jgi:hypothetical protein
MTAARILQSTMARVDHIRDRIFSCHERLARTTSDVERMEATLQLASLQRSLVIWQDQERRARCLVKVVSGPASPPVRIAPARGKPVKLNTQPARRRADLDAALRRRGISSGGYLTKVMAER